MDDASVGRRVAAARRASGYETRDALTGELELPNFGAGTLGRVERGERHLFPHEAEAIARALAVDVSSFYAEPQTDTQLDRIERALAELQQRAQEAHEEREAIMVLLDQQEQVLRDLTRVAGQLPSDARLDVLNEEIDQLVAAREAAEAERDASSTRSAGTRRRAGSG